MLKSFPTTISCLRNITVHFGVSNNLLISVRHLFALQTCLTFFGHFWPCLSTIREDWAFGFASWQQVACSHISKNIIFVCHQQELDRHYPHHPKTTNKTSSCLTNIIFRGNHPNHQQHHLDHTNEKCPNKQNSRLCWNNVENEGAWRIIGQGTSLCGKRDSLWQFTTQVIKIVHQRPLLRNTGKTTTPSRERYQNQLPTRRWSAEKGQQQKTHKKTPIIASRRESAEEKKLRKPTIF